MTDSVIRTASTRSTESESADVESMDRGIRRLTESLASMQIYAAILRSESPLTIREILRTTPVSAGTVYPIIQKRVRAGVLIDSVRDGVAQYELSALGFEYAQKQLATVEVSNSSIAQYAKRCRHLALAPHI